MAACLPRFNIDRLQLGERVADDVCPAFVDIDLASLHVPFPGADVGALDDVGQPFALSGKGMAAFHDIRDVVHDHIEAFDLPVRDVGQIVGQRMAVPRSVRAGDGALELLLFATQCRLDVRAVAFEQVCTQQVLHGGARQCGGVHAKPCAIGLVGHPVAQVLVPVADHGRHGVQHRLQVVARRFQLCSAVFHLLVQAGGQIAHRLLGTQALADVAHEASNANDLALGAAYGARRDRNGGHFTLPGQQGGVGGRDFSAGEYLAYQLCFLVAFGRWRHALDHGLTEGLGAGVAKQPFGGTVPADDQPIVGFAHDGVCRVLHNGGELGLLHDALALALAAELDGAHQQRCQQAGQQRDREHGP